MEQCVKRRSWHGASARPGNGYRGSFCRALFQDTSVYFKNNGKAFTMLADPKIKSLEIGQPFSSNLRTNVK